LNKDEVKFPLGKEISMEKNTNSNISHKVGDAIEKAGDKISDMGAPKAGNKVYNTGDKLEHSQDQKVNNNKGTL
jgi:hypothetical protein